MTYVHTERRGRVCVVTLDDASRRNALSLDLCAELESTFDTLDADDSVGAVVITGAPPAFCAGADLSQLGDSQREGLAAIYSGFMRVARSPLPTLAAVNGAAVGAGMNLALCTDLRIAAHSARFDTRFVELGLHPGGGHTWMMRRLIGQPATMAAVLFGEVLDAAAALRVGLVWEVCEDEALLDRAVELATVVASAPPGLARRVKATILDMADVATHEAAVEAELDPQVWSINEPAFAERLAAMKRRISSTPPAGSSQ